MTFQFRYAVGSAVAANHLGRAITEAFGEGEPLYLPKYSFWIWGDIATTSVKGPNGMVHLWGFSSEAGELWLLANLPEGAGAVGCE